MGHVYSPKSVVDAMLNEEFSSYWTQIETYEALRIYIDMNFGRLIEKCYLNRDYVGYEEGQKQIQESNFTASTKERMQMLFAKMRRKQTIDAAFICMECQNYRTDDLLKKFEKLGINPVPLRQGYATNA